MVIKSKIYEFLKENLGEYLYGFEKNQLDVGLLSGRIELVNVNFRPDKVNELLGSQGLPIHIKAGLIGKLKFKCNYISFLTSPVEVELDELLLVFGPISHIYKEQKMNLETDPEVILWQLSKEDEILNYGKRKARSQILLNFYSQSETEKYKFGEDGSKKSKGRNEKSSKERRKSKRKPHNSDVPHSNEEEILDPSHLQANGFTFEQKLKSAKSSYTEESYSERPKEKTFIEKYFTKVLRNLSLTVKSVHISYEDESYSTENPFSIGFSVEKLEVKNISQEWTVVQGKVQKASSKSKTSIKELLISNASIYIYGMASAIIPTSLWESTINSEIGIFDAFPAYEVRDFIIHQSKLLSKDHPSTFLSPASCKACITFSDEFPELRAVGLIEDLAFTFTPIMAECLRNFYDYCTNVQIWPLILRYRPAQRIPPRTAKREHRKERKFRREIVTKWFNYAYQFAKLKCAALKYVKERRKERDFIQKMEKNEKIRAKATFRKRVEEKVEVKKEDNGAFSSIFNLGKNIKAQVPSSLGGFIGNGNKKPPVVPKQSKRPYDGEKYFNKVLCNSEVEFHLTHCKISIHDDSSSHRLEIEFRDLYKCTSTLMDEMTSVIMLQDFVLSYKQNNKSQEFFRCSGKKYLSSSASNHGLSAKFIYRPAEVLNPSDLYTTLNMYETSIDLGTFNVNYNHQTLIFIFNLASALRYDKTFRMNINEEFVKAAIEKMKKRKEIKFFNKEIQREVESKQLARQIAELQKWLECKIVEFNPTFNFILFCLELKMSGGTVGFHGTLGKEGGVVLKMEVEKTEFKVEKTKESTCLSGLGYCLRSGSTPAGVYDFLMNLVGIFSEKMKRMRRIKN